MRPRHSFSSKKTRRATDSPKMRKQRAKYPELIKKIVIVSDIILEVLDARFIKDTRNLEIEKQIKSKNKKIIYVLNKSDLVKTKKIPKQLTPHVFVSCTSRKGIGELRELIKANASRIKKITGKMIKRDKIKKSEDSKIIVGVIGYPNTGKSSLINLLVGKKGAGTGAEAGFTKNIQKLKLTSEIMLLDSPGVIPESEYSGTDKDALTKHTKVGGRSYSQIKEPEIIVANLIKEFSKVFDKFYNIKSKGNSEILLEELGKKKGFLKKGGKVNEDQTARLILKDWQMGKIKV